MSPGGVSVNFAVNSKVLDYTACAGESFCTPTVNNEFFCLHSTQVCYMFMHASLLIEVIKQQGVVGLAVFIVSTEKPKSLKR